ncbi:MAG: type II toxin-antitoxin system prevent-host-death family antitoxin [Bryobacteraceae bacterium]
MGVTATELRKDLFHNLDLVVRGEPVVITYKGVHIRLVAAEGESKLARAVERHALRVDPDSIIASDADFMRMVNSKWAEEDKRL